MNAIKKLLNILKQTCIFFTLIVVLFYLISNSMINSSMVLETSGMFLLLGFSFILALCNLIFGIKKLPIVVRSLIHYLLIAGIILFAFFYFTPDTASFGVSMVIAAFIAVIYAICTAIAVAVSIKIKTVRSDEEVYSPQFANVTGSKRK